MSKFTYLGVAKIKALTVRKEGDDEKILACTLGLQVTTDDTAFLAYFDPLLRQFLVNSEGAPRNPFIEPLKFSHTLEHYRLDVAGIEFGNVQLKGFSVGVFTGKTGKAKFEIDFKANFKPGSDDISAVAESILEEVEVEIEPVDRELT